MMDEVHAQLTRKIPGANPPRLIPTKLEPKQIELHYISKRGLFDYFLGILDGCSEFFKESLKVEIVDKGKDGDKFFIRVRLTLEKGEPYSRKYKLASMMSLGFLKSIPLKISLGTTLLSLVVFLISQGLTAIPFIYSLCVFIFTYILSTCNPKTIGRYQYPSRTS